MKASAIQAARYAAWERTVWFGSSDWSAAQKTDQQIQREVQQRFFSATATAKLQASDGGTTGWGGTGPKALWRDRGGNPMLVAYDSDVTQTSPRSQTPGTMNAILVPVVNVISIVGEVLGGAFVLDMNSLYTSTVRVQTVQTRPIRQVLGSTPTLQTFQGVTPLFAEKNVLIANGWNANGSAFVKQQTEGLMPLSFMGRDPIKTVLEVIQYFTVLVAPELMPDWLKLGGEIQPDLVPDDRLK
ncbi:MAG: hypothetical protein HYV99_06000 [Betaproteobacteria bacterium]|nr:hypothetical protein [Betaproteobacteria bacterium]